MWSDPDWMLDGLCREVDPDLWFPKSEKLAAPAIAICRRCAVIEECLAYALEHGEQGVWGGLSDEDRQALTPVTSCG